MEKIWITVTHLDGYLEKVISRGQIPSWVENIRLKSEIIRALEESIKKLLYDLEWSEAMKVMFNYIKMSL